MRAPDQSPDGGHPDDDPPPDGLDGRLAESRASDPEPSIQHASCGRKAESPLQIPPAGWSDLLWRMMDELNSDNVVVVAAGVAFFGLLAFVPTLGSMVAVYGLWADPQDVARHVAAFSEVLPAAGGKLVRIVLEDVVSDSRTSLSLSALAGIVVAIWGASRGMRSLMRGLTIAYDEDLRRGWVHERALSLVFTAAAIAIGALTIAIVVVVPSLLTLLGLPTSTRWLRWPALTVIFSLSLSALYRYGAARTPPKWRWTVVGALVATALWLAGSSVLSLYVHKLAHFDDSYGPLGGFLVLMLWFFVTSFAVLLGAELNAELEHQTEADTTMGPSKPLGERGAFVADHVGACRPPLRELFRENLGRVRSMATKLRARAPEHLIGTSDEEEEAKIDHEEDQAQSDHPKDTRGAQTADETEKSA